ncbi:MAG: carbohydrate ABC transporter permease [Chloroflexi bacterium]|nr:carbohydrate ABC transporter permease [Chloroflexota bacterium]
MLSTKLMRYALYALVILLALPFVFPSLWVLMASFSTNTQITMDSLALPDRLYVENYIHAWTGAKISSYVYNSLAVSGSVSVLIGFLATMLGYAVSRLDFPGRRLLLLLIMMAIVMPVFAYLEPLTRVVRHLGLSNSRTAVILTTTATFLPVPTLLMRSFFLQLPEELGDAGRVEGASEWGVFRHIMAPLARSGILTVLIFAFLWSWNDLLMPVVFLQSPDKFTIAYAITTLKPAGFRQDHVTVFAASIISTGPMIVVYLLLMRRFIAGLTVGGLRG